MRLTINFYECEHRTDLDEYLSDLRECGAEIVHIDTDYNSETADVEIEIGDVDDFLIMFRNTYAFDFSNHAN